MSRDRVRPDNQGFATLGYRAAQESVGEEWMLLEVGLTIRSPAKDFTLKREHLKVKTPDGTTIGLARKRQYAEAGYLRALNQRMRVMRDAIDYFPVEADRPWPIQFYANLGQPGPQVSFDQMELSSTRGCLGRPYFHVPGGIKVGQHWLIVSFGESEVQVPFGILTKEEAKACNKSWEDIKKVHEESLSSHALRQSVEHLDVDERARAQRQRPPEGDDVLHEPCEELELGAEAMARKGSLSPGAGGRGTEVETRE
jgi:hypothetical protein